MEMYNIHEAKTNLSALIKKVEAGEKIVICNNGVPVADLVSHIEVKQKRIPGRLKGKIWMSPDMDAVDKEIESWFYADNPNDPLNEYKPKLQ